MAVDQRRRRPRRRPRAHRRPRLHRTRARGAAGAVRRAHQPRRAARARGRGVGGGAAAAPPGGRRSRGPRAADAADAGHGRRVISGIDARRSPAGQCSARAHRRQRRTARFADERAHPRGAGRDRSGAAARRTSAVDRTPACSSRHTSAAPSTASSSGDGASPGSRCAATWRANRCATSCRAGTDRPAPAPSRRRERRHRRRGQPRAHRPVH